MNIDNKEFLAVKASDLTKVRVKLLDMIDKEIDRLRQGKISEKELTELQNQEVTECIADTLDWIREEIEERFWIDQIGDGDE